MRDLDISERQIGDVTILDLDGEFRIGDASLRDYVGRLKEENKNKIVLNLADLNRQRQSAGVIVVSETDATITFPPESPVYDNVESAVRALGEGATDVPWLVDLES